MVNIIIVNKNIAQRKIWFNELSEDGYKVIRECTDIYTMINILTDQKVHIIICASNALSENDYDTLLAASAFYSRVKLVLVGPVDRGYVLVKLPNVILQQSFNSNLEGYCQIPVELRPEADSPEADELAQREVSILLKPHFLLKSDVERLLIRWQPHWKPNYTVMTIIADSFHDLTYSTVSEALNTIKNVVVFPQHFDKIQILFHSLPPERQVVALAYKLRKFLLKFTDATFSIGISRCRTSPDELWASADEAHRAASSGNLLGQNSVIHIGYIDHDKNAYVYPHHKQKRMLSCALSGNGKEALRMLDEIFDALKKAEKLPQSLVNKIALGIFVDLNIAAVSKARAFEKIQMDAVSIGDLINAKSIQDVHRFLKSTIEYFATEMANLTNVKSDILFVRLEKYVRTHPNFDLDDMVRHFKTTVQVLNTSVYNNTGGSIFDYVQVQE